MEIPLCKKIPKSKARKKKKISYLLFLHGLIEEVSRALFRWLKSLLLAKLTVYFPSVNHPQRKVNWDFFTVFFALPYFFKLIIIIIFSWLFSQSILKVPWGNIIVLCIIATFVCLTVLHSWLYLPQSLHCYMTFVKLQTWILVLTCKLAASGHPAFPLHIQRMIRVYYSCIKLPLQISREIENCKINNELSLAKFQGLVILVEISGYL